MTDIVNRIGSKILSALDAKGAHDVNLGDIVRLLVPAPRASSSDVATNSLLLRKLGLDLITPARSFEGDMLALGVTDAELDELLG
jgi:hypothetical protein